MPILILIFTLVCTPALALSPDEHVTVIRTLLMEAVSEGDEGLVGVAEVIRTRVKDSRWPDTPYKVVTKKGWNRKYNKWVWHFSCNAGDRNKNWKNFMRRNRIDGGDWQRASRAWETSATTNTVEGANLYHNKYMTPDWDWSKVDYVTTIKNHKFWRER